METAMIDKVKEWLKKYDGLKNSKIRTDYLEPEDGENYYSLEQDQTSNPSKIGNVLGTKFIENINFTLAGRFDYDVHSDSTNNNNLLIMQKISNWIIDQNLKKNYPVIADKIIITEMSIKSGPYLYGLSKSTLKARYQFEFNIKYERRL